MAPQCSVKRVALSIETKIKILDEVERNAYGLHSKAKIAKAYNLSSSSLSTILKNKEKIRRAYKEGCAPNRVRQRDAKFPALENALLEWTKKCRSKNICVNRTLLKAKAETFALQMDLENEFSISDGWITRFNKRHGLVYRKLCGESSSVDMLSVTNWREGKLKELLNSGMYSPEDVYNADETGLVYQLLPCRSYVFKNEPASGEKRPKVRITILLAANMAGTDKLPLLVVGKARKPRCFKGIKTLPAPYKANKNSWMTAEIFEEWVRELDRRMKLKGRKILLVVDNCTAHPQLNDLEAIRLEFLPANTTSVLQPMDQGVIFSFKQHYRKMLLNRIILSLDNGKEYKIDLLGAISLAVAAWKKVEEKTVANCFRHAGFVKNEADENLRNSSTNDVLEPTKQNSTISTDTGFFEGLRRHALIDDKVIFEDYVNADNDLECREELSDSDIVDQALKKANEAKKAKENADNSSDDESEADARPRPTIKAALEATEVLQEFFKGSENVDRFREMLSEIEDHIFVCASRKQSLITGYFKATN